jgi:hypothetical protein
MNRTAAASLAIGLALLAGACGGGGKSTSSATKKVAVAQHICSSASSTDLAAALGATPKGTPKDVSGGHGCVWRNAGDAALAVVVYDTAAAMPSGNDAAKTLADALGLDKGGFSSSSITTSNGKKPVALLLLSNGDQAAATGAERSITDAAIAAAG